MHMMMCRLGAAALIAAACFGTAQAQIPQITTMAQARFYATQMAALCGAQPVCRCVHDRALRDAIEGGIRATWLTAWYQLMAGDQKLINTLPNDQRARAKFVGRSLARAMLPGAAETIYQDACKKTVK